MGMKLRRAKGDCERLRDKKWYDTIRYKYDRMVGDCLAWPIPSLMYRHMWHGMALPSLASSSYLILLAFKSQSVEYWVIGKPYIRGVVVVGGWKWPDSTRPQQLRELVSPGAPPSRLTDHVSPALPGSTFFQHLLPGKLNSIRTGARLPSLQHPRLLLIINPTTCSLC
jgi:hypothetical protein